MYAKGIEIGSLPSLFVTRDYIQKNIVMLKECGVELMFKPDCLTKVNFLYTKEVTSIFQEFEVPVEIHTSVAECERMLEVGSRRKELVCWSFEFWDCIFDVGYVMAMKVLHEAGYKVKAIIRSLENLVNVYGFFRAACGFCDLFVFVADDSPVCHLRLFLDCIVDMMEDAVTRVCFSPGLLVKTGVLAKDLPLQFVNESFSIWK